MTSNSSITVLPEAIEVPVENIDFSPNIGTDADQFFQTDADIARQLARQGMVNYDKGKAVKIPSKILDMCLGPRTLGSKEVTMYFAESGHIARRMNVETGKTLAIFTGHTGPVTRVAAYKTHLGDERLVTASWDKTVRVWSVETKACLAILRGHTDFVKGLALRPVRMTSEQDPSQKYIGYELFSGAYDGQIRHWDLQSFKEVDNGRGGPWKGHSRGINDLILASEENHIPKASPSTNEDDDEQSNDVEFLYSASSDGTVRKWDIAKGRNRGGLCVKVFKHHATSVYKVLMDPTSGEMWTTSADKTCMRVDLETAKADTKLFHPDFVKAVTVAGPYVITGGRQETIRIWSVASGKLIREILGHFDEVSSLLVVGSTLYSGSLDGTLRQWSLADDASKGVGAADSTTNTSTTDALSAKGGEATSTTTTVGSDSGATESNNNSMQAKVNNLDSDNKESMLTEEEERELAELMGSDEDD